MRRDLIKVYSHPRSGTHFVEAFLAKNLYRNVALSSEGPVHYGHWSNKILLKDGEPYHKLFGSHFFPADLKLDKKQKKIYIYRDGRAVIFSIWKSKFYHKSLEGISFSEFLRKPIDWHGGLGQSRASGLNIVQHWFKHVNDWHQVSDPNLLIVRYEDLKLNPERIFLTLLKKFFFAEYIKRKLKLTKTLVDRIDYMVGVKPNEGQIDSWYLAFTEDDLAFFNSHIETNRFLYQNI